MTDVPPEIWALIAQHLPPKDVIRLISVNRLFYALAMDEKYKSLVVGKVDRTLVRTLDVLRTPTNAKRVRSFRLDPSALRDLARAEAVVNEHHQPSPSTLLSTLFSTLLSPQKTHDPPTSASKLTEDLSTVLPLLRNVHTFSFTWDQTSTHTEAYIPLAWRSLGTHLLHLHLTLHPRSLTAHLPSSTSFPQLLTLRLALTVADDPRDVLLPLSGPLSSFINKFSPTLESLYIGSPQRRDLQSTYASLTRFPRLAAFELSPHTFSSPSTLLAFLRNHADTLRSFTYVSDSNPLFVTGLSDLELNALERLTMRLHYVPYPKPWWTVPSAFFSSVAGTLRVLVIEGAVTVVELDQVLRALVGDHPNDAATLVDHTKNDNPKPRIALQSLTLSTTTLSPALLTCLASRVPHLKSLNLRIHDVVAGGGSPITPSEFFPFTSSTPHPLQTTPILFTSTLAPLLASLDWTLEDLTITRRACCGDIVQWGIMIFVAEHTPTIQSFAHRGSKTIPDPPNAKPAGRVCPLEVHCPFWEGPVGVGRDYSP